MKDSSIEAITVLLQPNLASDSGLKGHIRAADDESLSFTEVLSQESSFNLRDDVYLITSPEDLNIELEQVLPVYGQELPSDVTELTGLQGLVELRALADAMTNHSPDAQPSLLRTAPSNISNELETTPPVLPSKLNKLFHAPSLTQSNPTGDDSNYMTFSDVSVTSRRLGLSTTDLQLVAELGSNVNTPKQAENASRSGVETGVDFSIAATSRRDSPVSRMEPIAQQQQVPYKSVEVVAPTELATHLRVLKSAGGGEARLQLHPAELGRMTIGLITEGEDARVTFIVDSVQAKQAVESSLPRLRDLLEEAGFTLSDSDVSQRGSAHDRENEADHMLDDEAIDSEQDTITAHEGDPRSTHLIDAFA